MRAQARQYFIYFILRAQARQYFIYFRLVLFCAGRRISLLPQFWNLLQAVLVVNTFSVLAERPGLAQDFRAFSECQADEPDEGRGQPGLRLRLQEQGEHQDQNSGAPDVQTQMKDGFRICIFTVLLK